MILFTIIWKPGCWSSVEYVVVLVIELKFCFCSPSVYDRIRNRFSGEWRVESGEWRVESGEWRVESGEWRVESGEWRVKNGEWKANSSLVIFQQYIFNLIKTHLTTK